MKRLLLIAALVAPTWLYSCMPRSVVPDPAVIVQETFDKLPPIPDVREIPILRDQVAPVIPSYKPKAKPHVQPRLPDHHAPVQRPSVDRKPTPVPRPSPVEAPVETLPPQQGVICIFPFNMVPQCTPEPAGRQP
jgi:hypothetical protein